MSGLLVSALFHIRFVMPYQARATNQGLRISGLL